MRKKKKLTKYDKIRQSKRIQFKLGHGRQQGISLAFTLIRGAGQVQHPTPAGGKIELVLVGSFAQRAGYPGQCRCPLPLGKRDEHGYGAFGQEV